MFGLQRCDCIYMVMAVKNQHGKLLKPCWSITPFLRCIQQVPAGVYVWLRSSQHSLHSTAAAMLFLGGHAWCEDFSIGFCLQWHTALLQPPQTYILCECILNPSPCRNSTSSCRIQGYVVSTVFVCRGALQWCNHSQAQVPCEWAPSSSPNS